MTRLQVIRAYFQNTEPHARKMSNAEYKELSNDERDELANLAAAELGVEVTA